MVEIGDEAPDFTLPDSDGKEISLRNEIGEKNVLLYFYPMAFSPVCTKQLEDYTNEFDKFIEVNINIIAVSGDLQYSCKEFKDKLNVPFTLLSDSNKKVIKKYAGLFKDKGFSNRAYFLIDKSGIIRWKHITDDPGKKLSNKELLDKIRKIS